MVFAGWFGHDMRITCYIRHEGLQFVDWSGTSCKRRASFPGNRDPQAKQHQHQLLRQHDPERPFYRSLLDYRLL